MLQERLITRPSEAPFEVRLARTAEEVYQAQRLRYRVFAGELGAHLPSAALGIDRDRFDAFCEHLIVRERASARVVGTYRILPPEQAELAGGWYSAAEFTVDRLLDRRASIVEVGRACVDPAYRSGVTIALLWAGLLRYVREQRGEYIIGCASLDTTDGGHLAASLCRRLLQEHLAPEDWRVTPRRAFALEGWREIPDAPLPALLKGYLRLGAQVCGAPAWDAAFNSADLLLVLPLARTNPRYVERLLRGA